MTFTFVAKSRDIFSHRLRSSSDLLRYIILLCTVLGPGFDVCASTRFDIPGPSGSGAFGTTVVALPNGNFVVADPGYDITAPTLISNVGAVHLYSGRTLELISTLVGSKANDNVGSGGVIGLPNGNFLVFSPNWDDGVVVNARAVTFVDGFLGLSAPVSAQNSLVGSSSNDSLGSSGIRILPNGAYVVRSPSWNGARGAVTWGSQTAGVVGPVGSNNSLVGQTSGDGVGGTGLEVIGTGNYVVISSQWNGARGAVTFCLSSGPCNGPVSSSNSLVGNSSTDAVGSGGIFRLSNGNYVVQSPVWNNGAITDAGAITFGSGSTGVVGIVSEVNSLVGDHQDDEIGNIPNSITELSNGHFVVRSPWWNSLRGAATWGNGEVGVTGIVSSSNSLVGSNANDRVSNKSVTALVNGNYVVSSSYWNLYGAVTFGNGTSGAVGFVSDDNSLTHTADNFGAPNVVPLANGHYVVVSSTWGTTPSASGAVTWGNGWTGVTGPISSTNSLVGRPAEGIGDGGVFALPNGNYVVSSEDWGNGYIGRAGAVTLCNGNGGTTGSITAENSLVGSPPDDQVSSDGIVVLPDSKFLVLSPNWNGRRGAVTLVDGGVGLTGLVTASNSLVGGSGENEVGKFAKLLSNRKVAVFSQAWDNGAIQNAGALTIIDTQNNITGPVSSANSLVGTHTGDGVGSIGDFQELENGRFVQRAFAWNGGRGAVVYGDATGTVAGEVSELNSLVGSSPNDSVGSVTPLIGGHYVVASPYWDNGPVFDAGAVTYCHNLQGCHGAVSPSNSLVGGTASDMIGESGITGTNGVVLQRGRYAMRTYTWDNGAQVNAGAVAVGGPSSFPTGLIHAGNSVVGTTSNGGPFPLAEDSRNRQTVIGRPSSNAVTILRERLSPPFDFDGDSKTDISIFRGGPAEWWISRSSDGATFAAQFGNSNEKLTPTDFTGDDKCDLAFWRPSTGDWFVLRSEDFSFFSFPFGTSGDEPYPADFDYDDKADATVFRQSTGTWYIRRSTDGGTTIEQFGSPGDVPVVGDYDGDGRSDLAIFRPSTGQWWIRRSTAGVIAFTFGAGSDKAVPGDYTGDGKTDIGLWRPSTGEWFVLRSEDLSFYSFPFGATSDLPAPGDYDGDGRYDATVFRPSNATWYSNRTTSGTLIQQFGIGTDVPVGGVYVR